MKTITIKALIFLTGVSSSKQTAKSRVVVLPTAQTAQNDSEQRRKDSYFIGVGFPHSV